MNVTGLIFRVSNFDLRSSWVEKVLWKRKEAFLEGFRYWKQKLKVVFKRMIFKEINMVFESEVKYIISNVILQDK